MIVKYCDHNIPKILFTNITGDQNLPAGKVSIQTDSIPLPSNNKSWPGKVLIRKDKSDPNGFEWIDVMIQRPSLDKIRTTLDANDSFNTSTDSQNVELELTHYRIHK